MSKVQSPKEAGREQTEGHSELFLSATKEVRSGKGNQGQGEVVRRPSPHSQAQTLVHKPLDSETEKN